MARKIKTKTLKITARVLDTSEEIRNVFKGRKLGDVIPLQKVINIETFEPGVFFKIKPSGATWTDSLPHYYFGSAAFIPSKFAKKLFA